MQDKTQDFSLPLNVKTRLDNIEEEELKEKISTGS